eukprot:5858339-Pleurochrysis_carterae.AAC.1
MGERGGERRAAEQQERASTAARVALSASVTRSFFSFTSVSVAPPTWNRTSKRVGGASPRAQVGVAES